MLITVVLVVGTLALVSAYVRQRPDEEYERFRQASAEEGTRAREAEAAGLDKGLAAIAARDPSFDQARFGVLMAKAFVEIQHAWSSTKLGAARRLMSDGVGQRFATQIALNDFHGVRNVAADVQVKGTRIRAAESDDDFDVIHLEVEARARDCDAPKGCPEEEVGRLAALRPANDFREVWSFVRRLAPGQHSGCLAEGTCPNCGANVARAPAATCEHCQATLNSGSFDWVLAEITQIDEFVFDPARVGAVPGFEVVKARDPALNRQVLEDRASLVFWKWVEARATGRPASFARLCQPKAFAQMPATPAGSDYRYAAVGAVELLSLYTEAGADLARFLVKWSTGGAGSAVRKSVLALARDATLKTRADHGFSTDRCHACGAAQRETTKVDCEYCNAPLQKDWCFAELVSFEQHRSRLDAEGERATALAGRLADVPDPAERVRLMGQMVAMAQADGVVTEREQRLLRACARRWAVDPETLDGLLRASPGELVELRPETPAAAGAAYEALVVAAWADGAIDRTERKLLDAMATHLRLPPEQVRAIEAASGGAKGSGSLA